MSESGNDLTQHLQAAAKISLLSAIFTALMGIFAVILGITTGSIVLLAFGATAAADFIGSLTLIIHFHHALRHREMSERLEDTALRVVSFGLVIVGLGAVIESLHRLMVGASLKKSAFSIAFAGVSFFVLFCLAIRKRNVAKSLGSPALLVDSHLSTAGAMLAIITLVGVVLSTFGWDWTDAVAALIVGGAAAIFGIAASIGAWRPRSNNS